MQRLNINPASSAVINHIFSAVCLLKWIRGGLLMRTKRFLAFLPDPLPFPSGLKTRGPPSVCRGHSPFSAWEPPTLWLPGLKEAFWSAWRRRPSGWTGSSILAKGCPPSREGTFSPAVNCCPFCWVYIYIYHIISRYGLPWGPELALLGNGQAGRPCQGACRGLGSSVAFPFHLWLCLK